MFKSVKFKVLEGPTVISTRTGKNVSEADVARLVNNPAVISITAVRMTDKEAFRSRENRR